MGQDIALRQPDIENLIRDKAALYAGSRILLSSAGLSFDDVERVLIAGNFGRSLDIEQAVRIGLLPDIPRERIRFIGNSSLDGAHLALLSGQARRRALAVAGSITTLELTVEPQELTIGQQGAGTEELAMPYYDYRCTACGAVFEVRASIKEKEAGRKVECPQCGAGEVRQVITAGLVIHSNSGDSRSLCGCGPNAGPGCCG